MPGVVPSARALLNKERIATWSSATFVRAMGSRFKAEAPSEWALDLGLLLLYLRGTKVRSCQTHRLKVGLSNLLGLRSPKSPQRSKIPHRPREGPRLLTDIIPRRTFSHGGVEPKILPVVTLKKKGLSLWSLTPA